MQDAQKTLAILRPDIVKIRFPPVACLRLALDIGDVAMAKERMRKYSMYGPASLMAC